jgi:hypothetical protein
MKGNDGLPISERAPPVQKVTENEKIAAFLNGVEFSKPSAQGPTMKLADLPAGTNLQYVVPATKYPGTKKRPYPWSFGQGNVGSGHKSDTDLHQKFGTPGGFEDNLDDYENNPIIEDVDEDKEFYDQQEGN